MGARRNMCQSLLLGDMVTKTEMVVFVFGLASAARADFVVAWHERMGTPA